MHVFEAFLHSVARGVGACPSLDLTSHRAHRWPEVLHLASMLPGGCCGSSGGSAGALACLIWAVPGASGPQRRTRCLSILIAIMPMWIRIDIGARRVVAIRSRRYITTRDRTQDPHAQQDQQYPCSHYWYSSQGHALSRCTWHSSMGCYFYRDSARRWLSVAAP